MSAPLRVYLTGTGLAGATSTARALGRLVTPPFEVSGLFGRWASVDPTTKQTLSICLARRTALLSVPEHDAADAMFARGASVIVFVADSQRERMEANLDAVDQLVTLLEQPDDIPVVFALAKRDLPSVCSLDELAAALRWSRCRHVPIVATTGDGVDQLLRAIVELGSQRVLEAD